MSLVSQGVETGKSLFRVGMAAIVDYVIQIWLGFMAYYQGNPGSIVLVHLTNAFVPAVLLTYLISFADAADKAMRTHGASSPKTM
jgi:heme A synthase